jgi:hypothetical protein
MADQTEQTDSGLNRDRMGQQAQACLSELDDIVSVLIGGSEVSGHFDRIIQASTLHLDDWVDGEKDGDDTLYAALDRVGTLGKTEDGAADSEAVVPLVTSEEEPYVLADLGARGSGLGPRSSGIGARSSGIGARGSELGAPEPSVAETRADVAEPSVDEYYVRRGSKVTGPVSARVIRKNIDHGRLRSTDEVGSSESGPWKSLNESNF